MNRVQKNIFVLYFVFLFCTGFKQPLNTPSISPDWRSPIEQDFKGDWTEYVKKSRQPFYTSADFNGDGLMDQAWILISTKETSWGLFVFLGQKDGNFKMILLDKNMGDSYSRMGIGIYSPGVYPTACAKGYGPPCKPDEKTEIKITNPALDYFIFESANSIFYWDETTNSFKRIWLSD